MSRTAAVSSTILYIGTRIWIGQFSLNPVYLLLVGMLTLAFVNGLRGTFAYRDLAASDWS